MRYVMMMTVFAALAGGVLVCPQAVRAQISEAVIPDAVMAAEIDAAIDSLIEQLSRMTPEFTPDGRV